MASGFANFLCHLLCRRLSVLEPESACAGLPRDSVLCPEVWHEVTGIEVVGTT